MGVGGADPPVLLHEAALELERAVELARGPARDDDVVEGSARAVVLALRALLTDRGLAPGADVKPSALPSLLGEAGLKPPPGVMRLIDPDGAAVGSDEALTAAHAAVAWSSAALTVL